MEILSFRKEMLRSEQKVLIYGAGNYGEIAFYALKAIGIEVDRFVDRAYAGRKYLGKEVISSSKLCEHTEDVIIIASLNYFRTLAEYAAGQGCSYLYSMIELMKCRLDENVLSEYARDEYNNPHKYRIAVLNAFVEGLIVDHIEVVITEKCSLRCKDCANLIPYFENAKHFDMEEIIVQLSRFLDAVDVLSDLRILGGEPFLHPEIDKLLKYAQNNPKIQLITIDTNSTVVPSQNVMSLLKHPKVVVHMSDYGKVSVRLDKLDRLFSEAEIIHYIHHYDKWNDIGDLNYRSYSDEDVQHIFEKCIMSKCHSFYNGKLYLCPRAGAGERIGAFVNHEGEYIDFTSSNVKTEDYRTQIEKLIHTDHHITACMYCNGSGNYSQKIDAAIQIG